TGEKATGAGAQVSITEDIHDLAEKYFATWSMVWPPVLLTLLYLAAFALCDSFLYIQSTSNRTFLLYPEWFVQASVPVLYAFVGVHIFNLGTLIRRLYLADINEQVFWGAINRLLLSLALAFIFMKAGIPKTGPTFYFSIGFLASVLLDWML